ncbi:UNVERIFIED_ORG: hypothetical protein GGD48_004990 [Rhizobium etli]
MSDEKDNAHQSRSVSHRRLDEQARQIAHLDTTMAIGGGVDATLRDEIKSLKETVDRNQAAVMPSVEEWRKMKLIGFGISGMIAFAGLTVGAPSPT